MTARTRSLVFLHEDDLEAYLVVHLTRLLSLQGQDLLVIGKQVRTAFGGRIDLLAIDAAGALHIIELKLGGTTPEIVGQVTDYLYWIRQLTRDEIIRVAARRFRVNLTVAFQEHFGHPLPETVNESQVLTIIAASIDLRTQRGMLAIRYPGLSTTMFRYVIRSGVLSLIPCCLDGPDFEASHARSRPPAHRKASKAPASYRSPSYRVHIDLGIRWFWRSNAHRFAGPIVTFEFVYGEYEQWVRARRSEGLQLHRRTRGQFGRQLVALAAESGAWTRAYLPPGSNMATLATLTRPPSTQIHRDAKHWIVGYLRNPGHQAPDA